LNNPSAIIKIAGNYQFKGSNIVEINNLSRRRVLIRATLPLD